MNEKFSVDIDNIIMLKYRPEYLNYGNKFKLTYGNSSDWYVLMVCKNEQCEYEKFGEGSYRELLDLQMDYNFKKEQIKEITNLILETIKQNKNMYKEGEITMTNFEKIKQMSKEELAEELKLVANWNRKQKNKAEKNSDNFYLDWLNAEIE